jgi:phosphoglucomutase
VSLLLTEMAAWYAGKNMTLYDALQALYPKYGYYNEKTLNLIMPGLEGLAMMKALMARLRSKTPTALAGVPVLVVKDYDDGTALDVKTGEKSAIELSGSNVLRFETADNTVVIVRPSGTEPKVKVYILANGKSEDECDEKIAKYTGWAETLKG